MQPAKTAALYDAGRLDEWRSLQERRLEYAKSLFDDPVEEVVLTHLSTFTAIRLAITAASLGQDELAATMFGKVVAFHEAQRVEGGKGIDREMQMTVAKAGLGRIDEAIEHLRAFYEKGYNEASHLHLFDVYRDRYGIFHGFGERTEVRELQLLIATQNQETLDRLQRKHPTLFAPLGGVHRPNE